MKRVTKPLFALLVCLCMCLNMMAPVFAVDDGVALVAALDTPSITASDADQTVTLRITTAEPVTLETIGGQIIWDSPLVLKSVINEDSRIEFYDPLADDDPDNDEDTPDVNLENGEIVWMQPNLRQLKNVTSIATATFTVPAGTAPGTYTVGIVDAEASKDNGTNTSFTGASASAILTILCDHDFSEKIEDADHLKDAGANCTKHNTYWYDCAKCDVISDSLFFEGAAAGPHDFDNGELKHDDDDHWTKCAYCDAVTGTEAHKGGTATCEVLAVCDVCQTAYGDYAKHDLEAVIAKDPIHTQTELVAGVAAHYECKVCGKWFTDAEGLNETNEDALTGETPVHVYNKQDDTAICTPASCRDDAVYYYTCECGKAGTETYVKEGTATGDHVDADGEWNYDEDGHFHKCGCGTEFDREDHHGDLGSTKNCQSQATCEVCEVKYGKLGDHDLEYVAKQEETHTPDTLSPAVDAHYECKVCEKLFTDAEGLNETNEDALTHETPVHVYDQKDDTAICTPASCSDDAVYYYTCECGKVGTETYVKEGSATGDHVDADGEWSYDEDGHFHKCGCGTEFDREDHHGDLGSTKNCQSQATCEVCEVKYGELGDHDLEPVAKQEEIHTPDTLSPEVDAHYECKVCEKRFTDAEGLNETNLDALTHEAPVHVYDCETTTYIYKNPGCAYNAWYYKTCVCGAQGTEADIWEAPNTATGEHAAATDVWEHDENGHYKTCQCGARVEEAPHSGDLGSTKNCQSQATCEVCEVKYGELGDHDLEYVAEQEETHTPDTLRPAVDAHYECKVCGNWFTDAEGLNETSKDALTHETPVHVYDRMTDEHLSSAANCKDNAFYYYTCECGKVGTETYEKLGTRNEDHVYDEEYSFNVDGHYHLCTVCETAKTVTEPHTLSHKPAVPASLSGNGVKEHYACDCGACFADAEGTQLVAYASLIIPQLQPAPAAPTTPDTGDNSSIVLWTCLLTVSILGMGVLVVSKRKERS